MIDTAKGLIARAAEEIDEIRRIVTEELAIEREEVALETKEFDLIKAKYSNVVSHLNAARLISTKKPLEQYKVLGESLNLIIGAIEQAIPLIKDSLKKISEDLAEILAEIVKSEDVIQQQKMLITALRNGNEGEDKSAVMGLVHRIGSSLGFESDEEIAQARQVIELNKQLQKLLKKLLKLGRRKLRVQQEVLWILRGRFWFFSKSQLSEAKKERKWISKGEVDVRINDIITIGEYLYNQDLEIAKLGKELQSIDNDIDGVEDSIDGLLKGVEGLVAGEIKLAA